MPLVAVVIAMIDRHRVQSQLLKQGHHLFVVTDVVPRDPQVLLVFLESVDIPMQIAGFDPLGLVSKVL